MGAGFGLGWLPVAPGTWASIGAGAAYLLVRHLLPQLSRFGILLGAFSLCFALGVAVCASCREQWGSDDPAPFVLDEIAGFYLACLPFWRADPWITTAALLVAFRFFDIVKPPPLRRLEKLPGAWGVMLDDCGAAVYTAALIGLLKTTFPSVLMDV